MATDTLADIAAISGIASTPRPDAYGHIVCAGAFDRSIRARGLTGPGGVKLLLGHDPNKPAGVITSLRTVGDALRIEADLNLRVSYVRDACEIIKQNAGLSFSVGFRLEDYEETKANLIIKSGDPHEVSIVSFPACSEAVMSMALSRPLSRRLTLFSSRRGERERRPRSSICYGGANPRTTR